MRVCGQGYEEMVEVAFAHYEVTAEALDNHPSIGQQVQATPAEAGG